MMNHLNGIKTPETTWYLSIDLCFFAQRLLDGGTKPFCWKMMGYKNFFYLQDGDMKFSLIVRDYPPPWYHGGGGSRLNFGQGCAAHCFKIAPLARPIFLKMIPLARLISTSKCHELAFSRQNLPNFCILWTKIWKKFGFLYRNYIYQVWHFFDQNCQKVYPCPD